MARMPYCHDFYTARRVESVEIHGHENARHPGYRPAHYAGEAKCLYSRNFCAWLWQLSEQPERRRRLIRLVGCRYSHNVDLE